MKYRVWCPDFQGPTEIETSIEAQSANDAAMQFVNELDKTADAFPNEEDGDRIKVSVAEWFDIDEDDTIDEDAIDAEEFEFVLRIERRIERA